MLTVQARAKINIALDVKRRLPNGYHEVDMIMQSIDLADSIALEPDDAIVLVGDLRQTPSGPENLVWRAAEAMRNRAAGRSGVRISLHKKIPVAAGLGGGSADAAAVIAGLNRMWRLGLSTDELHRIGGTLGADVPFCLRGGAARATGIGTELKYAPGAHGVSVVLFCPPYPVSTAEVYQSLRLDSGISHPDISEVWRSWRAGDLAGVRATWGNVLETATFALHPPLAERKRQMAKIAGSGVLMSGSGPTLFCLADTQTEARKIQSAMSGWPGETIVAQTVSDGLLFGGD